MTIILDAMGSDQYPEPEILAALQAAELFGEEIILVGKEDILRPKLDALNTKKLPVVIEHAPDVLEMGDKAVADSNKKRNNSMAVGMKLLKNGRGQAFVSAGNTGGVYFNAMRTLGRIKGVQRAALTALFPTKTGFCVVLDIGANAECRPDFLLQFALMGSIYAEKMLKIQRPRVGILSNGEEAGKGNQLVKDAYPLLANSDLNFIGNVEGKELFGGDVDVVVTDGFTGNVMLKSVEAASKLLVDFLRAELKSTLVTKLGAALAMPALKRLRKKMDPEEVGAAPLLGIDGLVFVGHGRSNAQALVSAIRVARDAVNLHLIDDMRLSIQKHLDQFETIQPAQ
ncbi:MAG: phosphate acyltransferase PlsX [Chloroflexota bacterium]|nr:MAG: phosphate acyltransferase PlsX [Chloroflexota bacterium]